MRYLITHPHIAPFYSPIFDPQKDWDAGMTVFDLVTNKHMSDGHTWEDTTIDSL